MVYYCIVMTKRNLLCGSTMELNSCGIHFRSKHLLTGHTASAKDMLGYGFSGVLATIVHDFIMNPAEVIYLF